ncbi:MAG: diacylglycerol kinase [Patescibacteria group bacterium]
MRHAWRGLLVAFKTERSFRIQVALAFVILLLILVLPLKTSETVLLLVVMAAVLVLELLNSTVERLVDLVKPRLQGYVRDIKDLMAATVLVASIFAAVIGILVLSPYLISLIERL